MSTTRSHRQVHTFAVFTACFAFLVLIAGALVTSNDAGLSVPDWPLSYGSLFPPMIGGIFYEHGHRMVAAALGLLSIVLAVWLWRVESRSWVRWLGVTAVGVVVAQGLLGGLTVLFFLPPAVSAAHATLAQIYFSTLVSMAFFTSPWWERQNQTVVDPGGTGIHALAAATVAATLFQLMMGAAFRHKGFGIVPHLIGAAVVTGLIFWLAGTLRRRFSDVPVLRGAARALHIMIGLQLVLGGAAWWSRVYAESFPQPVPVTVVFTVVHTVTGAIVLASTVLVTLTCYRLIRPQAAAYASVAGATGGPVGGHAREAQGNS
jgi:cytochrome c oxidase assembly protein subunit 15